MPIEEMTEDPADQTAEVVGRPEVRVDARRCFPSKEDGDAYWVAVVAKTMADADSTEAAAAALTYAARRYGGSVSYEVRYGPHADDGAVIPPDAKTGRAPVAGATEVTSADQWRQLAAKQNMAPAGRQIGYVIYYKIRRPESVIR